MFSRTAVFRLLVCAFAVAPLAGCASFSSPAQSELDEFDIPYLTTRAFEVDRNGRTRYSTEAAEATGGACTLTHASGAELDPKVDRYRSLPIDEVLESLYDGGEGGLLVYIHGFNTGLKRACREAAVFAAQTGFEGRLLLFSWPASSAVFTYWKDQRRLAESIPAMARSFDLLSEEFGASDISVVAHSMGSLAVAARAEADPAPNAPFGDLVLVAPDMDLTVFAESLPALKERFRDISVLVSDSDRMLLLSEAINAGPRLGRTTDMDASGVEVVDVTDLGDLGFGNHLYHLRSDEVAEVLRGILAD